MAAEFFQQRPEVHPTIYAYVEGVSTHEGFIKVGYTERDVAAHSRASAHRRGSSQDTS